MNANDFTEEDVRIAQTACLLAGGTLYSAETTRAILFVYWEHLQWLNEDSPHRASVVVVRHKYGLLCG